MEPEATQNIIHQNHPILSSWYIHQSVRYSKYGFILLMLISFMGRVAIYLSVAIRELEGLQDILILQVPYLPPPRLHTAADFPASFGDPFLGVNR